MPNGTTTLHSKFAPNVVELKVTTLVASPEHITSFALEKLTNGVGFTVMVNVCGIPSQLFALGVTVRVAITG
jgi:hypothetical protein